MVYPAEELYDHQLIEEALANFAALIDDLDFGAELDLMGIGRLQFLRRKQMQIELKGLYIALWRLALAKSFPQDADHMFSEFLARYDQNHHSKNNSETIARAHGYWGMLAPSGDSDFNAVARHLISFLDLEEKETRSLGLRLALHIRSAYRFIFERLI